MDLGRIKLATSAVAPQVAEASHQAAFDQLYNAVYLLSKDLALCPGVITLTASEQILKGQAIQIYAGRIRRADSGSSKPAIGVSVAPADLNGPCRAILGSGYVSGLSGLTEGSAYYVGINGVIQPTPPGSGMVQGIGYALSDTELFVTAAMP